MRHIRTVTPSWLIEKKKELADGIATLERIGFRVSNRTVPSRLPSPVLKARELHRAFADPKIDIILAQRGGYSVMKVLPHLDFGLIARTPKIIAGFSDMTALLNPIYERCGFVTFHSPMVLNFTNPTPFTVSSFLNALSGFPEKNLFAGAPLTVYRHGKAAGTLKGGNLITLTALIKTPWDVPCENAIIFLEDVDEKLHQIDRYLTQWILAGKFKGVKGLILGDFRGVKPSDVFAVLSSQMKITFPVVHCPFIGHVPDKITLPVGAAVRFDTRRRELLLT